MMHFLFVEIENRFISYRNSVGNIKSGITEGNLEYPTHCMYYKSSIWMGKKKEYITSHYIKEYLLNDLRKCFIYSMN